MYLVFNKISPKPIDTCLPIGMTLCLTKSGEWGFRCAFDNCMILPDGFSKPLFFDTKESALKYLEKRGLKLGKYELDEQWQEISIDGSPSS